MKDLKHLIFFENLLQDAQNELVEKAKSEGQLALGYNCYYIPDARTALHIHGHCRILYDQPVMSLCAIHSGTRDRRRV